MKIALCTGGTRGDVQPALALAAALREAGHEARLAGPPENKDWVESYGVPFTGLSMSVEDIVADMSASMTMSGLIKFMGLLKKGVMTQLDDFPPFLEGCDLAVGISLVFGLKTVAEQMNIPYLYLATSPQILPSASHPTIATKNQNLPGWVNRLDWWAAGQVNSLVWMRGVNKVRKKRGLPVFRGRLWNHILEPMVLVISDEELCEVPADVTQRFLQVGHLPLKQKGELGEEVEAFLDAGPPPVYIGFGSMPGRAEETSRIILEAARLSGQRLIMGSGWAHLIDLEPGQDHLLVGSLPHDQLFPRMAAVVHHGGAGTTATAARAGAPQIIVPHYFDQFFWAERIIQAGLGPRAPRHEKLTGAGLGEAVREAVTNPSYSEKAEELAGKLGPKDPLAEVIRFIETNYGPK